MALVIRLTKIGRRGEAKFRVIVTEKRSRRDGRPVESLGWFEKRADKSVKNVNKERYDYWVEKGAKPSPQVTQLMTV